MLNMKKALTKILTAIKGTEKRTLLWTNASPTSDFPAQTINLDLSGHDAIEIEYDLFSNNHRYFRKIPIGWRADLTALGDVIGSLPEKTFSRTVDVYTNSISFGDGYYKYNNTTVSFMASACIPKKIYGIKEN